MTTSMNGRKTAPRPRSAPTNGYHQASIGSVAGQTRTWRTETTRPVQSPAQSDGASGPTAPPRRRLTRSQWIRLSVLVLVLTALGAAAGYGAARLMPVKYAAHADINYRLTREQPTGFLREDRNISTQLVLLKSRAVLQPIADRWHMRIDDLTAAVNPAVTQESEIITIDLTDRDPLRAKQLLDAVVQRYLTVSNNEDRANVEGYLDGQLTQVTTRINQLLGTAQDRTGEMDALVSREQWLRQQLDEARLTDLAGPGASLLVPAYTDSAPLSPKPLVTTSAGAAAALVVALLAVAVVARRMTRP